MTEFVQVARAGQFDDIPIYALADGSRGDFDKSYVHQQVAASDTWVVNHNLGKRPAVTILDTSGNEVEGDVQHIDNGQLVIIFSVQFSGEALCN